MRGPAEFYSASPRAYQGLPDLQYAFHDRDILVTACGRMHAREEDHISTVLAAQKLGIKEVEGAIWLVSFMHHDLGYRPGAENLADHRQSVRHEIVTQVSGTFRHRCLRAGQTLHGGERGIRTPDTVLPYTHFPGVRLQPLGHLSPGARRSATGAGAHLVDRRRNAKTSIRSRFSLSRGRGLRPGDNARALASTGEGRRAPLRHSGRHLRLMVDRTAFQPYFPAQQMLSSRGAGAQPVVDEAPAAMVRFLFRLLALIALAVATIMAVVDATRSIAASRLVTTPLGTSWAATFPDQLAFAEQAVRAHLGAAAWDSYAATVLQWPGFAVFGGLALILYAIGRRPGRRPAAFAAEI
jgi:hypothetical protein